MSESSASGGGTTTPVYSTPLIPRSELPVPAHHGSSLSAAQEAHHTEGPRQTALPAPVTAAPATQFYASGNSRIALSAEGSPLYAPVAPAGGYMYDLGERNSSFNASGSSLDSAGLEDSQKHSYHPIELMLGGSGHVGSLESAGLARHLSVSMPSTGGNVAPHTPSLTAQESLASTSEQALSPIYAQPITHGLKPPTLTGSAKPPPVNVTHVIASTTPTALAVKGDVAPAPAQHPASLSDSLASLQATLAPPSHQRLPKMRSEPSNSTSQLDASPSEPSMTVRGATPSRLTAVSHDFSRFPSQPLLSPNSSGKTHRTASPSSDSLHRPSRPPFVPVPRPPTAPDLQASRPSTGGSAVVPLVATPGKKPGSAAPVVLSAYETPLALVASSSSSSSNESGVAGAGQVDAGGEQSSRLHSRHGSEAEVGPDSNRDEGVGGATDEAAGDSPVEGAQLTPGDATPPPPSSLAPDAPPSTGVQPLLLPVPALQGALSPPQPPLVPRLVAVAPPRLQPKLQPQPVGDAPSSQAQQQPQPAPPPPPVAEPPVGADFVHFSPLIQQFDFRKTDIKGIACTGSFTMGDVNTVPVKLRPLRHEVLGRAEPIANIQQAAMAAGRVKALKLHRATARSGKAARGAAAPETAIAAAFSVPPPRPVDVSDLDDTLVLFDNALLAVSFALWGSVAPYNDLVTALRSFCVPDDGDPRGGSNDVDGAEEGEEGNRSGGGEGGAVAGGAPSLSHAAAAKATRRVRVPFSSVLRFLNHCGVDVIVTTPNRKAATSFCAKRRHVCQRCCCPSPAAATAEAAANTLVSPRAPRRVLVALSYDRKNGVWCPLTTTRPIRQIAAQWHQYRRQQRRHARRDARREERRADAEAAAQAQKAAVEAKLRAWQERTAAYRGNAAESAGAVGNATAAASADAAAKAEAEDAAEHAVVVVVSADSTSSEAPSLKPGKRLPFEGVLYPNLVQTDFGFALLLRQGMHPLFKMARLRFVLGVPLGLVTVLFGLAFIIYVSKTTGACLADAHTGRCVVEAVVDSSDLSKSISSIDASDSNGVCLLGLLLVGLSGFHGSLADSYLYGAAVAPGRCLVVAICCGFAALVDGVLIVYFAVRYLALGGVRPCFFYVLRGVQAVLGAVVCAFAAYTVFVFHRRQHIVSCSWLAAGDATLCASRLASCDYQYAYAAYGPQSGVNVPLVLAIVHLVLCVLHGLVAALPVLPSVRAQDRIPTATPDAYAFRPSLFAPDGPTPAEVAQLRQAMQPPLRQELRHHVQARDRLLTTTTTIGEMMQANRAQSLRQMELNEERRQRRARPFQRRAGDDDSGRSGRGAARRLRYMVVGPEGEDGCGSRQRSRTELSLSSASLSSSRSGTGGARRSVVLAPRLVQRVAEISTRVRERRVHSSGQNPFHSPSGSLVETAGDVLDAVPVLSPAFGRAEGHTSQPFTRSQHPGARAVVLTEDDSFSSDSHTHESTLPRTRSALVRQMGIALPTYAASARSSTPPPALRTTSSFAFVSTELAATSPRSPGVGRRSATSSGTNRATRRSTGGAGGAVPLPARRQSTRSNFFARMVSTRSVTDAAADVVSPTVEAEIDHIVTRLRAQDSAEADKAATAE